MQFNLSSVVAPKQALLLGRAPRIESTRLLIEDLQTGDPGEDQFWDVSGRQFPYDFFVGCHLDDALSLGLISTAPVGAKLMASQRPERIKVAIWVPSATFLLSINDLGVTNDGVHVCVWPLTICVGAFSNSQPISARLLHRTVPKFVTPS